MKGFPNQIADLGKIAEGMAILVRLADSGKNARDDGIFGRALVEGGVAGTGHVSIPVAEYLRTQLANPPSNQSFRTTARGLRELYRLLNFIDDSDELLEVTELGRRAAAFAGLPTSPEQIRFWRRVISNMTHAGSDGESSHPYQVLLRLVGKRPGITRGKCALALEAKNDSPEELERISALADLSEAEVRDQIAVSNSNWDNAKKVLPKFAEQLGDVVKTGQSYVLAVAPGLADETTVGGEPQRASARGAGRPTSPRPPRTSRAVTPETIGRAGTAETFDEAEIAPQTPDPEAAAEGVRLRRGRLRRHNLLVRELATAFQGAGAELFEDPFDTLALVNGLGILAEVKTLDGTAEDERDRVRDALSQLLYYEAFVTAPITGESSIRKIAVFEKPISASHRGWLNRHGIGVVWKGGTHFHGDALAREALEGIIELHP